MNETKFTNKAVVYDKSRPGYPEEAIDYMLTLAPKNPVAADVGSGTGKLSEALLKRGYKVYAIEPNEAMRWIADKRQRHFGENYISVNGYAENTTLAAGSVDLVTVAQSLHWFDIDRFRQECVRILKPDGRVFILYNKFAGTSAPEYEKLLYAHCPNFKGLAGGECSIDKIRELFSDYVCRTFESQLSYDLPEFIDRALSASYTPTQGEPGYEDFVKALEDLFIARQRDGKIVFRNITTLYHSF